MNRNRVLFPHASGGWKPGMELLLPAEVFGLVDSGQPIDSGWSNGAARRRIGRAAGHHGDIYETKKVNGFK